MSEQDFFPQQEFIPSIVPDTDPNAVVKFTQSLRYKAVDELTGGGKKVPDKIGDLMMVLRDMDQSALTTRKLNIEEKSSNDGRRVAEAYERMRALMEGRDPLKLETVDGEQPFRDPTLGLALPEVSFLPGEDHQGEHQLNVADFLSPDE